MGIGDGAHRLTILFTDNLCRWGNLTIFVVKLPHLHFIMRLGIDIGGTNTVIGIVTPEGKIIAKGDIRTVGHDSIEGYIKALKDKFNDISPAGLRLRGVGIGAPCSNMTTGCIEGATDLPWHGTVPMAQLVSEAFGVPAAITNDANAAAAGEMEFGVARGLRNFIMLTLGTGVGAGVVCDGRVLSGSRGFAGELGHVTLGHPYDRKCTCGRRGCLQMYCSGGGIVATTREMLADKSVRSVLRAINLKDLTARDVMTAARGGDPAALEVYRLTGQVLGEAVANFLAFSDPEAVVLFGGVAKAADLLTVPMQKAMEENTLFLYRNRVKILLSTLPDADAAILGAAALI